MNPYAYQIVTPPTESAVTGAEMERHARAQGQPAEQYEPYILAAQGFIERGWGRKLVSQTWKMFLDCWPCTDRIIIPFGRLTAITHVKYTDTAAAQTTFAASSYEISTAREPGVLALKYGQSWPSATLKVLDPIEIQFTCGWASAGEVPSDIRNAILLVAGHLYEHREDVVIGNDSSVDSKAIELGSRALLVNWKLHV